MMQLVKVEQSKTLRGFQDKSIFIFYRKCNCLIAQAKSPVLDFSSASLGRQSLIRFWN